MDVQQQYVMILCHRPQTVCSRAIRVLCMCMGLGDTDGQREIQVDMNKGEHEQRWT